MLQPNEIYLNGNNSTVQIASAHETSKTFSYNGNEVLFDIKDDVMVNATQLAKIYGKHLKLIVCTGKRSEKVKFKHED